ncbi:MAG: type I DNA topoisomerase [Desulfuromonadia bacterium]
MPYSLVIVESPAKAKTIEKFLGPSYRVLASYGHVRALPSKQGSVDVDHGFAPNYQILPESKKHIDAIRKMLDNATELLLATDPDREGEAISWHLCEALGVGKGKLSIPVRRIVFHEITKQAILEAVRSPRSISDNLVNAQQARVILDYLVGFTLSPFLWKKIRYGLSAGRVQSVALRFICEREKEIRAFVEQEYWTIKGEFTTSDGQSLTAQLVEFDGAKLDKFTLSNEGDARRVVGSIVGLPCRVSRLQKSQKKRNPAPPFTTSTLQQEASRKLGFSTKKTMSVAQKLYEGIDIGEGTVGLITYMRTDSVVLSSQALDETKRLIETIYGKEYALPRHRLFKNRAKNAQEAHEAIRPTSVVKTPAELKRYLTPDQFRLYDLIWKRTVACQMAEAILDQTSVDIAAGEKGLFRATGSVIRFPGYMKVYTEGVDDDQEEREGILPPMEEGAFLALKGLLPERHLTQPPPRYTEATLVKTLEEYGIGRPSTYASIMNTLLERKYARLEQKRFHPEDVGMVVNDLLTRHFSQYVDYGFTAALEEELDRVSRGEKEWKPLLQDFWGPFIQLVHQKEKEVSKSDITTESTDENCPECGRALVVKLGRRGKFIACSGYAEGCRYTRDMGGGNGGDRSESQVSTEICDKCGSPMLIKKGRYGAYLACSNYPACRNNQPLEKPKGTGIGCPKCGKGELTQKKSRYGKMFYSCNRYPDCTFALWDEPVARSCPKCGFPLLVRKFYKRKGEFFRCPQEGCGHEETSAE